MFTLKISEFVLNKMTEKNKFIYNSISQIIDEFHSNSFKSENTYSVFINYLEHIIGDLYSDTSLENTFITNTEDIYNKTFLKFISKNVEEINEYIKEGESRKINIAFPEVKRRIKGFLSDDTRKETWMKMEADD